MLLAGVPRVAHHAVNGNQPRTAVAARVAAWSNLIPKAVSLIRFAKTNRPRPVRGSSLLTIRLMSWRCDGVSIAYPITESNSSSVWAWDDVAILRRRSWSGDSL